MNSLNSGPPAPDRDAAPPAHAAGLGHGAIVSENVEGYDVVHVFGEVDLLTSPVLERAIETAHDGTTHQLVVVDFTECRYLDSTTLSVLIRSKRLLGERLRIVVPDGVSIRRLFDITNLAGVLHVVPTIDAAIH